MKNISILFAKELRSYYDSPIAYIFIIMFLLLSGAYFVGNLFPENVASLRGFFEIASILLLFFAPAVTMRSISEEKRLGTFEVVHTTPVDVSEFVMGKFLSAWSLVVAALFPTIVYASIVSMLGSVDGGQILGGYLGLLLLGGSLVAVGMFGSSLSDNSIVALIIGFVLGSFFFLLDKILLYLPAALVPVGEFLSLGHHFSSLARGVVDTRDVLYYLSFMVIFVLLAMIFASRERGERILSGRSSRVRRRFPLFGLVTGVVVLVNLLSIGFFVRLDMTRNEMYTLSDATRKILASLNDNFMVSAYFSTELPPPYSNYRRAVQELLDEYRALSHGKFHYQFLDPSSDPMIEQAALQNGVKPIDVKVLKNDRFTTQKAYLGLAMTYADRQDCLPLLTSVERIEYDVTSAMKKLTASTVKTVGLLTREGDPGSDEFQLLRDAISRQHAMTVVDISRRKEIPDDVMVILIIAPARPFSNEEMFLLDQYLMRGGRIGFFLNRFVPTTASDVLMPLDLGLDDMFDTYGWILNPDVVIDTRCASITISGMIDDVLTSTEIYYPAFPSVSEVNASSEIVRNLGPVVFRYVSTIDSRLAEVRGMKAEVLLTSSATSRALTGDQIVVEREYAIETFSDKRLPLAVTFEGSLKSHFAKRDAVLGKSVLTKSQPTKIAVVGDGDFLLDGNISTPDNIVLGVNLVDWLLDDAGLMLIRARDVTPKQLDEVSVPTKTFVKYFTFAAPPGIVVVAGVGRLLLKKRRRKKHQFSY